MKFCKDCDNILVPTSGNMDHASCKRTKKINPVTGKVDYSPCIFQRQSRMFEDDCGPDARHFEPINTNHMKGI